jgi:hypothetical protein
MLLKMIDGGILNIEEDQDYTSGCETCDYGSNYVNSFDIELTTIKIHIEASQMYEYVLSEGHMMKAILPNVDEIKEMTEIEFAKWLKEKLSEIIKEDSLSHTKIDYKVTKQISI